MSFQSERETEIDIDVPDIPESIVENKGNKSTDTNYKDQVPNTRCDYTSGDFSRRCTSPERKNVWKLVVFYWINI